MDIATLKRKIRKLKNLEIQIRFGNRGHADQKLVGQQLIWNSFFDLSGKREVKYPLSYLLLIDNDEYRKIADEFLAFVYRDIFESFEIPNGNYLDRTLLVKLGLPYDADINDVKKRFRQLAKQYHPDKGGDAQKFIELMQIYEGLVNGRQ